MAELKGVFKNAYTFAQQYVYIINNGVASSFRTPLSSVCEDMIRIYEVDACDYMKHFQLDGVKLIFLFTKSREDCYRAFRYSNNIFVVVPVTSLFETLDNKFILQGILDVLTVILNFSNVMRYGSETDKFKAMFAAAYFMSYTFCSCYELDDKVREAITEIADDNFGDIVKIDRVLKALTSVREERFEENTSNLFTNHAVLAYMDSESLEAMRSMD